MYIRDVNSYIAVYDDGKKVKRKSAYSHSEDLQWNKNHSSQVIAKAAEAALVHNKDIREFIMNHDDFYDFMMMIKVPRSSNLMLGERQIQNTSRVYISTDGESLFKYMPPLAKQLAVNPDAPFRKIAQCKGWLATECNDIKRANRATLNYEYYIKKAKKLVETLK